MEIKHNFSFYYTRIVSHVKMSIFIKQWYFVIILVFVTNPALLKSYCVIVDLLYKTSLCCSQICGLEKN